jgi:hypothetical protein
METRDLSRYSDGLWAGRPGFDSRQRKEILLYFTASRPALGPTQPPIQWVPESLYPGSSGRGVKLTTHLHLVLILRIV